jgi:hypothetical protein
MAAAFLQGLGSLLVQDFVLIHVALGGHKLRILGSPGPPRMAVCARLGPEDEAKLSLYHFA